MPDPETSRRDWRPAIRARLAHLSIAPSREAEILEELTQHLDDRWRELMARGETAEAAARIARTEFNGARLEALLGTLRQTHWHEAPPPGPARAVSLDSVVIDLRHAIRALRATPSFTLGALLVLALGTGATTAIFSNVAGRFLFGLDPRDPRAYAIAMITLVTAALIATVLPARRAASIDPTEALRSE